MILTISSTREFIPAFNKNKKLPASEQIKIVHKMPTTAMKEKLFPRKFEMNLNGVVSSSFEIDRKKIINELTVDIINVKYKNDVGEETVLRSADDLFDGPIEFDKLIEEIYTYYNELLNQKVNEKN